MKSPNSFRVYSPPEITAEQFQQYLDIRNPDLGWPPKSKLGTNEFDPRGARPSPAFPGPGPGCVSTYGDSLTYGEEVGNADAWGEQLALKLGCRVANFGVPGYGTDQALLRYQSHSWDDSPVVLLGIYQENILRVVNQYCHFLSGGDPLLFKPRFVFKDGELTLILLHVCKDTRLEDLFQPPFPAFKHEQFLPGSADGPAVSRFPYTFSVIEALLSRRVQNGLRHIPNWLEFYHANHPSQALQLMVAIVEQFAAAAKRREQDFHAVILPSTVGYQYRFEHYEDPTRSLSEALQNSNISYLDLSEAIHSRIGSKDYCDLLTNELRRCSGHYNVEGNLLVADILFKWLSE